MTTLLIVESPGKVSKLRAILGMDYQVMASVGHVRDLPQKELGIEPSAGFRLDYQPTERGREVLAKLKGAVAKADGVLLAMDPDREGEAIAWHLADALKLKDPKRVTFTAITEAKVQAALETPRPIDMQLVHAQEARRALDRAIGYRVSPALSNRTGKRLSAGRVQSPGVCLVVDREREIANFKPTKHFGVELIFDGSDTPAWKAAWDTKPHLKEGEQYLLDAALAARVAEVRNVVVSTFKDTKEGKGPAAPFTTSALQQEAGKRLKLKPARTMELAQGLYENGKITYHRTDDPNLDQAGIEDVIAYAQGQGLPLSDKPRRWKAKKGAQEGHEAIRPTHVADLDAGEDEEQKALYRLIWQRAVASQLADAVYAVRTATLDGETEGLAVSFVATGRTLIDPGWQAVYAEDEDEKKRGEETAKNPVPELAESAALVATDGRVLDKVTKPPTRFKQPTLVAELERRGIGRPSTYAAILTNITSREYVTEDPKGFLRPSPDGEVIRDALVDRFGFSDYEYTRGLEEDLDRVAGGETDYEAVVAAAWEALDGELEVLDAAADIKPEHPCPECGKALLRREGKKGPFWGCLGYPKCEVTLPDDDGKPGERKAPPPPTGIACRKCGKDLAHRKGTSKKTGKPYDFYGCPDRECGTTYETGPDGKPVFPDPENTHSCRKCGKDLAHRKGTSKKTGKPYDFYGCPDRECGTTYETGPDGKPVFPDPENTHSCRKCGKDLAHRKGTSKKTGKPYDFYGCPDRECGTTYETGPDGKPVFPEA